MAEAALALLSPVISALIEKMVSGGFRNLFRRHGIDEGQLQKLEVTLTTVTKVVGDAEQKQFTDRPVQEWLDHLKDAAFTAQDFLDEVAYEVLKLEIESGGAQTSADAEMQNQNCTGQFRKFLPCFNLCRKGMSVGEMEPRLKEIHETLECLVKQMGPLGLEEENSTGEERSLKLDASLLTTLLVDASDVYGRDGDKERLVELLRSDDGIGMNVGVVLIVGMGGLGKTTLAQLVYNDDRVQQCFDVRAWVYVPKVLEAFQVTRDIMKEVGLGNDIDKMTANQMHYVLEKKLSGNKVLLVLDDVWGATQREWDSLMKPFMSVKQGSKIIVTTRDSRVAHTMPSVKIHSLAVLNEDNCWRLFAKRAFCNESYHQYPDLEEIGREMVKKCNGLPLAAKALGGILFSERRVRRWKEILNTNIWAFPNDEVLPALRLSYSYLPSSLKQCFAYCAMFPKNYRFKKEELVLLWVAEGFIAPSRREDEMEMIGEIYFEDLVSRSFLQQQSTSYGKTFFTMHDLLNDMATVVSREFCSRLEAVNSLEVTQRSRYLSYINGGDDQYGIVELKCILGKPHFLRTLVLIPNDIMGVSFNILEALQRFNLLEALKRLRVLHLPRYVWGYELPDSIGILKHLRFLSFGSLDIQQLPESICELYNLQILILRGCQALTKLPNNMRKLVNLFLLDIRDTRLQEMPPHMGELTKLQKLSNFVVGKQKQAGSSSDIKELAKLHNLRGRLCVEGLQNVMDLEDAMDGILRGKLHLEELALKWGHGEDNNNRSLHQLLEELVPHRYLKSLFVYGYRGERFANWVGDSSFSYMVSLKIVNCKILSLPPVCRLASLERLTIESCDGVASIGSELHSMKKLRYLSITSMQEWCEWISDGGDSETNFPLLQELEIESCPKLRKALPSHLPSVAQITIGSCEQLEIECFSLECFPMLKELKIWECPKLVSFCKGRSPNFSSNLASVSLLECPNLKMLPPLCSNLEFLWIRRCPEIEFFPTNLAVHLGGSNSKLRKLVVSDCKKLFSRRHEWGLEMLPSLLTLEIHGCDEVEESFPEKTLLLPSTLTTLHIENLPNMKYLNYDGLQPLTSLRSLWIGNCHTLQSLQPNQNQKLPTSLSVLDITHCPLLTERCQPEKGVDWPFISHISTIYLNDICIT